MSPSCTLLAVTPAEVDRLKNEPAQIIKLMEAADAITLALDSVWHSLHFLITGSATESKQPLGFLLSGGEALGDFDHRNGSHIRVLDRDGARMLDEALAKISDVDFCARYDPASLYREGLFPGIWSEPDDDLGESFLMCFQSVKDFIHQVSKDQRVLIIVKE